MKRSTRRWLLVYLAALVLSHLFRAFLPASSEVAPGDRVLEVPEVKGEADTGRTIRLAYLDSDPTGKHSPTALPPREESSPQPLAKEVVVLVHGSPGDKTNFAAVLPGLAEDRRVLVPDLPGFGRSTHRVADYSARAHARYVLEMLDALKVERAHLVGFSLGGAVVLSIQDLAPERVASISLVAAVGVQELELLGDYHLNHALHALQLGGLWLLEQAVPHFGALDNLVLGLPYARNFFDTDQRPLRGVLERYPGPMLIVHSSNDVLVPMAAAREHHRIAAQSELEVLEKNHFFVFTDGETLARRLQAFFGRVEGSTATTRATADPRRLAAAALPFDSRAEPPLGGLSLALVLLALAAATLVSEDLTCIGAGLLVSSGRLSLASASVACLLGIYLGDLLLYSSGRWLGCRALHRRPFSWLLRPEDVERSSRWFDRRGPVIILLSRFLPGTRLPTYFAAGLFRTRFWRFNFYFLLAAVLWTPLVVGLSAWLGAGTQEVITDLGRWAWLGLVTAALLVLFGTRILLPALSRRGRRLLRGKLRRLVRWEYWPPWVFYPPVVVWVLWLGLRYRSPTLFTAANPAIPAGGFLGESKSDILAGLSPPEGFLARWVLLPSSLSPQERQRRALGFLERHGLDLPVVLKPDAGQRGIGVQILRDEGALRRALVELREDVILQEYVAGQEFGVFYVRLPEESRGRIFSVTEKQLPEVVGDGRSTIEELILEDPALLAMAPYYLRVQGARLEEVLPAGRRHRLVELGTHCRGAVFLDGREVLTPELEAAFDELSRSFEGFYFGRYDVRTADLEAFRGGTGFKVLELNGVTSEATHIYDPANSLVSAYRTLFEQWRLAFEIGHRNALAGTAPTPVRELLRLIWTSRRPKEPATR